MQLNQEVSAYVNECVQQVCVCVCVCMCMLTQVHVREIKEKKEKEWLYVREGREPITCSARCSTQHSACLDYLQIIYDKRCREKRQRHELETCTYTYTYV